MAFCIKCGAEISDDASFCYKCGYPVEKKNSPETVEEKTPSMTHNTDSHISVEKDNFISHNKKWFIVAGAIVVVCLLVIIQYSKPSNQYKMADKAFAQGNYEKAIKYYKGARNYGDAPDKLIVATRANAYTLGVDALDNNEFEKSLEYFTIADGYEDSDVLEKQCYYELAKKYSSENDLINAGIYFAKSAGYQDGHEKAMEIGTALLERKEYETAKDMYKELGEKSYLSYCEGMIYLNDLSYTSAKNKFKEAQGILDADEQYRESEYLEAIDYFKVGRYDDAITAFSNISDYKDAADYCNYVAIVYANKEISNGNLNKAKAIIENIAAESEYDGVTAGELQSRINANSKWVNICGRWMSTGGSVKSIQDGGYAHYGWNRDIKADELQIDIRCILNSDGTVTVKITGKDVPIITSYSIVAELVEKSTYKINYEGVVTEMGKITINDDASFTISPAKITFNYKKVDLGRDVFFKYIYTSDITYGNHVSTY